MSLALLRIIDQQRREIEALRKQRDLLAEKVQANTNKWHRRTQAAEGEVLRLRAKLAKKA